MTLLLQFFYTMKQQLLHSVLLLFGLSLLFSSCLPEPDLSTTPQIEYDGLTPFRRLPSFAGVGGEERDSVVISVKFSDGDGNLGDNTLDSTILANRYTDGWGNYEIKTFQLLNGKYVELQSLDNRFLLFPRLSREGQRGAITGLLDFRQIFFYSRNYQMLPVKFQIRIRDRDLNVSNTIETDTIRVPILVR